MEFDLTSKEGLSNIKDQFEGFQSPKFKNKQRITAVQGAKATIDIDIEGILSGLFEMTSNFINRFFDLFDTSKKLEKQMELAKETIRVSRELGAKSINITIDSKNKAELKAFVEQLNGDLKAKHQSGSKITYNVEFE